MQDKNQDTSSNQSEPAGAPPLPEAEAANLQPDLPIPVPQSDDDPATSKAIDEISSQEADEVLAAEDQALDQAFKPKEQPQGWRAKIKHWIKVWWNNPKARYGSLAGLAVLVLLLLAIPPSRYFMLNNVGVRSSSSLTVLDDSTQQPLKNVQVQLAGVSGVTNDKGQVKLQHLKLGHTQLKISRRAFAAITNSVTLGWGSNPLGSFNLVPTGSQYSFAVSDFLSGKALDQAEANGGGADANADSKGKIVLTIDPKDDVDGLRVTISSPGYLDQTVTIQSVDKSVHEVKLVPSQKHFFVSKRSGKYDLYKIDADGQNQQVILAGTGFERSDYAVIPKPDSNLAAIVSTRKNQHDSQGYLLSTLSLVDDSGQVTDVASSEKIQVLGWMGSRLIYVQVAAGASASNPRREQLESYDQSSGRRDELASSNYFNDLLIADGKIYYAPSDAYQTSSVGFYVINPDAINRQTLLPKEVWNIFRDQYGHFNLSVGQSWYSYDLGDSLAKLAPNAPASQTGRLYQDSTDGKNSLWVDSRDGKGVLLEYDTAKKVDKTLVTQSGLSNPIYWLNDHYVVYRVQTDQQTADYVLNLDGGQPRKITDVTNTAGVTQWYYY